MIGSVFITKDNTFGEVYFIGEVDRRTGRATPFVKIGIVQGNGKDERDSESRLKDHQTGNPRDLVLLHVSKTPSPYWVESGLHQRFSPARVRNEWYEIDPDELDRARELCERLAAETMEVAPLVEQANELSGVVSNGNTIDRSDESTRWFDSYSNAETRLKCCEQLTEAYINAFSSLPSDRKVLAEQSEIIGQKQISRVTFDIERFKQECPDVYARYTVRISKISGKFTPAKSKLSLQEIAPDLARFQDDFMNLCEEVRGGGDSFEDLAMKFRDLEVFEGAADWEKRISIANLKVICGVHDEIDGQCKWKRTAKESETFDEKKLKLDEPDLYSRFMVTKEHTRTSTRKRPTKKH